MCIVHLHMPVFAAWSILFKFLLKASICMTVCGVMRLKSAVWDLAELLFSFLPASQVSPLPGQGESIFAWFSNFLTFQNENWIITPPHHE